jgi:hypothetical protein
MTTQTYDNLESLKLSPQSRLTRIIIGSVLLAVPMTYSGVLGAMSLLPLLAIYPILTGILGYGLVELFIVNKPRVERPSHRVKLARISLLALGASLIATAMISETAPTWLALLGIFPVLMAALDSELFGEAMATRRAVHGAGKTKTFSAQTHSLTKPAHIPASRAFTPKQAA